MDQDIEYGDERRGRGVQTSRFGTLYGKTVTAGPGGRITRRFLPPNEQAASRLEIILRDFPNVTKEFARNIREEFVDMPQISTMNMEVFAASIYMTILAEGRDIDPAFFIDNVDSVLFRLDPGAGADNRELILEKYRESVFRYLRAILNYRGIV
jgi:hypothetical protein